MEPNYTADDNYHWIEQIINIIVTFRDIQWTNQGTGIYLAVMKKNLLLAMCGDFQIHVIKNWLLCRTENDFCMIPLRKHVL